MRKRRGFVIVFFIFILLSLILFAIFGNQVGKAPFGFLEVITSPIQNLFVRTSAGASGIGGSSEIVDLKRENKDLVIKKAEYVKLEREVAALRDQYESSKVPSRKLLPVQVVGMRGFVPGVSVPDVVVVNKGASDGVRKGQVVIYKDVALGQIDKVSSHLSEVMLLWNPKSLLTIQDIKTGANGVLKGKGGGNMRLENVLLSEKLAKGDSVATKGEIDSNGLGFPPDIVIGKIISIDKKQSALFQNADIASLIDISKISEVFIIVNAL